MTTAYDKQANLATKKFVPTYNYDWQLKVVATPVIGIDVEIDIDTSGFLNCCTTRCEIVIIPYK